VCLATALALLVLLAACQGNIQVVGVTTPGAPTAIVNSDDLMSQELFEGGYAYGFETSAFLPCGLHEQWWVTPANGEVGEELVRMYNAISDEQFKNAYSRLRGKISARGKYGHLGFYEREFVVTEVVDLRARQEGDCPPPAAPASPAANAASDELMGRDLFEGSLALGVDTRTFSPCGISEGWWVSSEDPKVLGELISAYNALSPDKLKNAFVRLRGKLSPPGSYGLLGVYERTFWVTEIVEVRQRVEGDCKPG
jgi:hypothetical protein